MAGTERQRSQLLKSPETKNNDMCINEGLINVAAWYRGTPDQSSRNSGSKQRLARPLMLPNFVILRKQVCEISAVENLCSQKSGPKFTKIP